MEMPSKAEGGCWWLGSRTPWPCGHPGGLHVGAVKAAAAFFILAFWLASACSKLCFRKYLAINKGFQ